MGLTHADETLRSGTVIPTTFVERMNLCGYKSTRRGWFKLSLELQVLSAFYKSNVLHFSKLYHHHHIRRKTSNAGHRAPPRFADPTGSAPRPSLDQRSKLNLNETEYSVRLLNVSCVIIGTACVLDCYLPFPYP